MSFLIPICRLPLATALIFLLSLAGAGLWTGEAGAQTTNGTLGATSTGRVAIRMFSRNAVQITGLDDVDLGTWSGSGRLEAFEFACVYSSNFTYRVTATSANGQGALFRLKNQNGDMVPYRVDWRDTFYRQRQLRHNQTSVLFFALTFLRTCGGGSNTRIRIRIAEADLGNAPSGNYADTLTLLIQPN